MSTLEPFFKNRCKSLTKEIEKLERENENIKDERAKRETLWLDHQRDLLDKNLKLGLENKLLEKSLERAIIALNFVVDSTYITPKNAEVVKECLDALGEITQMKMEAGENE